MPARANEITTLKDSGLFHVSKDTAQSIGVPTRRLINRFWKGLSLTEAALTRVSLSPKNNPARNAAIYPSSLQYTEYLHHSEI